MWKVSWLYEKVHDFLVVLLYYRALWDNYHHVNIHTKTRTQVQNSDWISLQWRVDY